MPTDDIIRLSAFINNATQTALSTIRHGSRGVQDPPLSKPQQAQDVALQEPLSPLKYLHQTQVTTRSRRYQVRGTRIQKICGTICSHLGVADYDLAVHFVGIRAIQRLNKDFRGKDKPTDVLSFPQMQWARPKSVRPQITGIQKGGMDSSKKAPRDILPRDPLGDIVIALDVAAKNAREIGQSLDREVCFLLVHGILHLCGHDHTQKAEEKLMLACQRRLMKILGEDSPKLALWRGCVKLAKRTSP